MSAGAELRAAPRPLLHARVAAHSLRVLASLRKSWRAKALISVWIAVAAWVWVFLARKDPNLALSVAIGVCCTHSIIGSLQGGAGRKVLLLLRNRTGRLGLLVPAATAFVYSSLVAGDWGAVDLVPYAYLGSFHLHHWAWSLGQGAAVLAALRCESPEACGVEARRTLWIALALAGVVLASLVAPQALPANASFQIVLALNATLLATLSLLLRSREFADEWAGLFTGISLGALLGIFASGSLGILRDFVIGRGIPSGLVFFE